MDPKYGKIIVMNRLGEPLRVRNRKKISVSLAFEVIIQAFDRIQGLHEAGVIHRDVKPNNIVKVGDDYKLIDFGLTRKNAGGRMTGYMVTRWFRPPELLELKDFDYQKYDGRCDMWSLATTAYFLQHGQPLFHGNAEEIMSMYKNYKAIGVLKYLICDYEKRWTAREMLENNEIELIEGSLSDVKEREGKVGDFVRCMVEGREDMADNYSHEQIYLDL